MIFPNILFHNVVLHAQNRLILAFLESVTNLYPKSAITLYIQVNAFFEKINFQAESPQLFSIIKVQGMPNITENNDQKFSGQIGNSV